MHRRPLQHRRLRLLICDYNDPMEAAVPSRWLLCANLVLAGCLSSPGDGDDEPAADAATTVHEASEPDVAIPDPGRATDEVTIAADCTVADMNVDVSVYHMDRGDLEITLESASHRSVKLKNSDAAETGADVLGNYPLTLEPVESFELVMGTSATGTWTLSVSDTSAGTSGTLAAWALTIDCG